jgi:hypothetical protein
MARTLELRQLGWAHFASRIQLRSCLKMRVRSCKCAQRICLTTGVHPTVTERNAFTAKRDSQRGVHWVHITPAEEKPFFPGK